MRIIITENQLRYILEQSDYSDYINGILDKISKSGMGSLTPDEKIDLDAYSKGEKLYEPKGSVTFNDDGTMEFDDDLDRELEQDREMFRLYHGCNRDCPACVRFFNMLPEYIENHEFKGFKVWMGVCDMDMSRTICFEYKNKKFVVMCFEYQENPSGKDKFTICELDSMEEGDMCGGVGLKTIEVPALEDSDVAVYRFINLLFSNIIPNFLQTQ